MTFFNSSEDEYLSLNILKEKDTELLPYYLKRQDMRITKLRLLRSHHDVECGTLLPGMLQLRSANYTTVR